METSLQENPHVIVPDDFYDNCLMEADGKGTFNFFDDDLTVPMTGIKKPGNWNDKWTFSDHTSFDVDPELYDVDLDRLIFRGYFLEKQQMTG